MRISLRSKVLLVAAINGALLVAALVWFARSQLSPNFGALLFGESRGRVTEVTQQLARDLMNTEIADRDALLDRYSSKYGVTFAMYRPYGQLIAGPALSLPQPVLDHLKTETNRSPLLRRLERFGGAARGSLPDFPDLDPAAGPELVDEAPFFSQTESGYWVVSRFPVRSPGQGMQPGVLILKASSFFGTPFLFNLRPWFALGLGAVLIVLACWLPLVRPAAKAIVTLVEATGKVAKGSFSTRVNINRTDELGQLGESFNQMASQLEGYVHGQKRFLRDAAHELRSPLARMQAALGNIVDGESELNPETHALLEDLREEIDLMSSLTGDLLTFARQENQQNVRRLSTVNLLKVAERAVATENPSGQADIRVAIEPDCELIAHEESLFRGLSNIIRNAIRYAGDGGPIVLSAEHRHDSTIVTLKDHGPGLPADALEMVFTPFYRMDQSRNRETGGNGLGMAIARSCIETCQGTIYCRNASPGLEVTITLRNG